MTDKYPISRGEFLQLASDCFDGEDGDFYLDDGQNFFLDHELDDESGFDCGFIPGEGCSMIGTEDCEFECPYSYNLMRHPAYPNCDLLASDYSK
jgi:hypothetical protein